MSEDPPKRRLPVLQTKEEPPADERSPWRWAALGAAATFLAWLPLSMLTELLLRRVLAFEDAEGRPIAAAGLWLVAGHVVAFLGGSFVGGLLVGRLGEKAGRREAAVAGALAGVLAWLIAAAQGTPGGALVWGLLVVIIATLGAVGGSLGGTVGLRLRKRATPP